MPGNTDKVDGIVRCGSVQCFDDGAEPSGVQSIFGKAHAEDQFALRCVGNGSTNDSLQGSVISSAAHIQRRQAQGRPQEVGVRVNQTRQHRLAGQVEYRYAIGVGCNVLPGSHSNDVPIAHGQCFGSGLLRVHGDDIGIAECQIGLKHRIPSSIIANLAGS